MKLTAMRFDQTVHHKNKHSKQNMGDTFFVYLTALNLAETGKISPFFSFFLLQISNVLNSPLCEDLPLRKDLSTTFTIFRLSLSTTIKTRLHIKVAFPRQDIFEHKTVR